MSDGRMRVIGVPPAGPALKRALAKFARDGTVMTSFDDGRLAAIKSLTPSDRDIDFTPIGELVGRFLTMNGEPLKILCPRGQLQATIDIVCKDLAHDSPFVASSRFPGTASLIRERLGELRDWNISSDDLDRVNDNVSSALQSKLTSLADVDRAVREILTETNREFASDRVARCLDVVPDTTLPIKRLLVIAGAVEKPLYENWLKWVQSFGIEIIVFVDAALEGSRLFSSSLRISQRLGQTIERFDTSAQWYECLFTEKSTETSPLIEILSTADPLYESEWIVRGCLLLLSQGTLPHQIAVFARDSETYSPLLQSVADRLGLPMSASLNVPLLTNGFACLIIDCLEALAGNDVRTLARIAHSTYIGATAETHLSILTASRAAYTRGYEQWKVLTHWASEQGEEIDWLKWLLLWRETAVGSRGTLSVWLGRLRDLVDGTKMIDLAADESSMTRARDINAQTVLHQSVRNIAYIYDRTKRPELGLVNFVQLARTLWQEETVVIGGRPNGVLLLSSTNGLTNYKALFVAGMLEGTLPRRRAEDPILFDKEREELSTALGRGISLINSRDKSAAERDEFVRLCSAATERIIFSYPEADDAKDNVPAFYLDELQRACPQRTSRVVRPRSQIVPLSESCIAQSDREIRDALSGIRNSRTMPTLVTDEAKDAIRPLFESGITPEHISLSLTCEFHAVLRHSLKLFPPARRRLMRSLRDLPSVASIATAPSRESAKTLLKSAVDNYLQDMHSELELWESSMLSAAAERLMDEWIDREFRSRDLWSEPGESTLTGVSIASTGLRNEIKIDGRNIKLIGQASSLTKRQNYTVMRFFDGDAPKMSDVVDVPKDNEDALLYGIYLMAQLHLEQRNPAIEVDGMTGGRVLAGFKEVADTAKKDPKHGINVHRISDSRDLFFQNLKERLREAIRVLDSAKMIATPGENCLRCSYGEICRVSSQFGETPDPFEERTQ